MDKMKELYAKVAGDSALQAKFAEIMKEAAEAGEETKEKLTNFAKEAGFEVIREEMEEFFKKLGEKPAGELSDAELDAVAGGKEIPDRALSTLKDPECPPPGSVTPGNATSCGK